MAISERRKLMMRIWKILQNETDPDHKLTRMEITARVLASSGSSLSRKEYRTNIETLCFIVPIFGYEIRRERTSNQHYVWVEKRPYSMAELQILTDMTLSSRFITEEKSLEMIRNMKSGLSIYQGQELQHQVYVKGRGKTGNRDVFLNSVAIQKAIRTKKRLSFYYLQWDTKKNFTRRHEGKLYTVSPVGVEFDNENYYLSAYNEDQEERIYRIDKMEDVVVTEECRTEGLDYSPENFHNRCRKLFGMFSAEEETVVVLCDNEKVGIFLDRFGKETLAIPYQGRMKVVFQAEISPLFFGWIYGLDEGVDIIGNEKTVELYDAYMKKMYNRRFGKDKRTEASIL